MTQPNLRTESLFKLTWPIFVQNTTHSLVVIVDFLFFSYLSDETAGTVGQLLPIIWMGAFVIPVFAGTGVSVASQYMGSRQFEKVVPAYMMNLLFTLVLAWSFAGGLWFFSSDIGRWMGMDESLNAIATVYLGTMSGYFVFMGVLVSYNAVISSRGMTHWLMYSAVMIGTINLALDSLFVFVFHLGVRGIVLASLIAAAAAMALAMLLVHRNLGVRFYLRGAVRDMFGVLRPMMRIGLPNIIEPLSYTLQQTVISTMIIAMGVTSMAANSYAGRAQMFQITFAVALALSVQILIAYWMGARRFDDVNRLFWRALRVAMIVAAAYSAVLWLASDLVLGVFTDEPAIKQLGKSLLFISLFLEPARTVNIIGGFALRTAGDARFPLVVGIIFIWGILPVIFLIQRFWGIGLVGLWICFAGDEIIRAGINAWRWRTRRWESMGIAHFKLRPAEALVASKLPGEP
ncbi:MAG TPA: MATE family efflux transporter [Opitutaceae bacterium]